MIAERYQVCYWARYTSPGWAVMTDSVGMSFLYVAIAQPGFGFNNYNSINPYNNNTLCSGSGAIAYTGPFYGVNFISTTSSPSYAANPVIIPFQVMPPAPAFANVTSTVFCDGSITQTPHAAMVVGLGDASVRTVSPAITTTTWLNACTPADGTPLGSDW